MRELIQEIKESFAAGVNGIRRLTALPQEYSAYTYRDRSIYGLAIEYNDSNEINEAANEVLFTTQTLVVESGQRCFLILTCLDEEYRNQFAELSYSFVNPGDNGINREKLLKDPISWWNSWIELLGDRKGKKSSYDVLAELIALNYLYQQDNTTLWTASEAGTHDIESDSQSFEVKSTTKKSESHITISSRFQLESANKLELFFFRVECSLSGYSINDVVESLCIHGYDRALLESQLSEKGFVKGRSTRNLKYALLEVRRYIVDDNFPKIVENSFKNDVFPQNIIKILYTIDLEGIAYRSIVFDMKEDGSIIGRMNEDSEQSMSDNMGQKNPVINIYPECHPNCFPLYSIRAACGRFLEAESNAKIEGWIDTDATGIHKHGNEYFVVQACGESMLPKIQDGAYCVFRAGGSVHRGDIVIAGIHDFDEDYNGRFTIKVFWQEFVTNEDRVRERESVTLKPLNDNGNYPSFKFDAENGEGFGVFGVLVDIIEL